MSDYQDNVHSSNPGDGDHRQPGEENAYSGGNPSQNTGWTAPQGENPGYGYRQGPNPNGQQGYPGGQGGWTPPGNQQGYQNPYGYPSGSPNQGRGDYVDANEPYRWNFEEYDNARNKKSRPKGGGLKILGILAGCMAGVVVLALAGVGGYYLIDGRNAVASSQPSVSSSAGTPSAQAENHSQAASPGLTLTDRPVSASSAVEGEPLSTPDIADKVRPSVVGILSYTNSGVSAQQLLTPNEGSGIIMSEDGYILTNAHVIEGAVGLKVVLSDGAEYEAREVGSDDLTDIAVIKVEAQGLPYAEFGNSDQLRVGEKVVAIGNPRGLTLAGSVTQGIVSATNRALSSSAGDITYIQTDAAINPGNSGGALVNEYGQVIGINTAKITQVANSNTIYEGIGFAIPITEAKPIIDDLKAYGRVTGRVRFGITVQTVDSYMAAVNRVPQGVMVVSTEEGSDIAAKGVMVGDIIYAVDGNNISSSNELRSAIIGKKPGDTVVLSVYRYTSRKQFEVEVALMEDVPVSNNG